MQTLLRARFAIISTTVSVLLNCSPAVSAAELVFRGGFEPNSTGVLASGTTAFVDLAGYDAPTSAYNFWGGGSVSSRLEDRLLTSYTGVKTGQFKIYYQPPHPSTQTYAKFKNDPALNGNRVLQFYLGEAADSSLGRIQADLYNNQNWKIFYYSVRVYFPSSGLQKLESLPGSFYDGTNRSWLTIAEFFHQPLWRNLDANPDNDMPHPSRISLGIDKGTAVGGKMFFRVTMDEAYKDGAGKWDWDGLWSSQATGYTIPYNTWLTLEVFVRENKASYGRFYATIKPDNGSKVVLFNIAGSTLHRSASDYRGYEAFNPMKLYTSKRLIDHVRNEGGALEVLWDDWTLNYGWIPTLPSTQPTPKL